MKKLQEKLENWRKVKKMQTSEFIEETSKIEKFYEKELDDFQRTIWFQQLKNLSVQRYRQIIKQVFNKCKFMPKLADIVSINEELPYSTIKENLVEKVECDKCNGLGLIFYKKYIDNGGKRLEYEYVARCDCQNGLHHAYDGTKINDKEHRSKYYIASAQQIGL